MISSNNSNQNKNVNYSTITLNRTNLVSSVNNNVYRYDFPGNASFGETDQIAISSVSIYNSFFNISTDYNNTFFQYRFYFGATSNIFNVIMPEGFYSISDINAYLQSIFITNSHYLIDGNGNFVYFMSLQENLTTYKVDLICQPVPTVLPAGWSTPVGFPGLPLVARVPEFIVPNTNITKIFGFNAATYPPAPQATTYSAASTFTPQITDITSVLMATNVVNNPFSSPANLIFSFPIQEQFAVLLNPPINELVFNKIQAGYYNSLEIQFLDNLYRPLKVRDTNVVITCVIKSFQ